MLNYFVLWWFQVAGPKYSLMQPRGFAHANSKTSCRSKHRCWEPSYIYFGVTFSYKNWCLALLEQQFPWQLLILLIYSYWKSWFNKEKISSQHGLKMMRGPMKNGMLTFKLDCMVLCWNVLGGGTCIYVFYSLDILASHKLLLK